MKKIARYHLLLALIVWAVSASSADGLEYPNPDVLVEPGWLRKHLEDKDLRIFDMSAAFESYKQGHIPGASFVSVTDIVVPSMSGTYDLPSQEMLESLLGRLGVTKDTRVIIYDDAGGLYASRLFFTLDVLGHRQVALLNGGKRAWHARGYPLTKDIPNIKPTEYKGTGNLDLVVTAEWILKRLNDSSIAFLDSRSVVEYRGEDVRAKRGGHIPGARNVEWLENLRPDGALKSAKDLVDLHQRRGITPSRTVVTYCQTHSRASLSYFVLRLLGYNQVKGYVRSWAEWGNREELPVEK